MNAAPKSAPEPPPPSPDDYAQGEPIAPEQQVSTVSGKSKNPLVQFKADLDARKNEFRMALPAHIPPEKFIRTTVTAITMNPAILKCDRQSILTSCMKAAQDGLVLDGREAALVSFGDKCTYMPMVQGIMKKARNSGQISSMVAHLVYENDQFSYVLGDEERIDHKPTLDGDRGKLRAVYAIVRLKDGSVQREVMTAAEVEAIRKRSRSANSGPWVTDFGEMARKSILRRICKYIPSSSDKPGETSLADVAHRDDELYDAGPVDHPAMPGNGRRASEILEGDAVTVGVAERGPAKKANEYPSAGLAVKAEGRPDE